MNEKAKHCNTCAHSYYQNEMDMDKGMEEVRMQRCSNPDYTGPAYTNQMLLEDWGQGCCRFWTPISEKGNDYEKPIFHRSMQCHRGGSSLVH